MPTVMMSIRCVQDHLVDDSECGGFLICQVTRVCTRGVDSAVSVPYGHRDKWIYFTPVSFLVFGGDVVHVVLVVHVSSLGARGRPM